MNPDKIIIIDFGSQYTKLIARKVRECYVYSEFILCTSDMSLLVKDSTLKGIILSGGPQSVYVKNAPALSRRIIELKLPILGICYGLHLLPHQFKEKITGPENRNFKLDYPP